MNPVITLEQWRTLIAVVETGGYAQASEALYKSQSAVSYAVQKIETLLGVKAFSLQGRKAILTATGEMLYRRALALVEEAHDLEAAAHKLSAGWEAEIQLAVEILFPSAMLLNCLNQFSVDSPRTRIELIESVLGGTEDALLKGSVDMAILPSPPPGFLGELILRSRLIAVAHQDHALHQLNRALTPKDLRQFRHLVVRDTGSKRDKKAVSVEVDQRWTVSHIATSIQAVKMGYGFAWLPEEQILEELQTGLLKPLALRAGGIVEVPLYLILANPDCAGPGVLHLANIIKAAAADTN